MNLKKAIVLILTLVFLVSAFSGCNTSDKEDDSDVLTLLYSRSIPKDFITALVAEFPDIRFELENYQGANHSEYIHQALIHGEASDIYLSSLVVSQEYSEKYLVDLSGQTFLGNFDNAILDTVSRGGRVYQLPGPVTSRCIVYNKTLFDMYGWEEPTSFNELLELVKQIRTDAPEITPIAWPIPATGYPFTMVTSLAQCGFLSTPEGAAWEERYLKGDASVAEGFDEGFTMMEQLIDANAFDGEKYEGVWHTIAGDFCERKAAMTISLGGTSPVLPLIEKTATADVYGSYCTDEFKLLPFFGISDGQEGLSITLSTTWGISKRLEEKGNEKKLENAMRVMEYLSTAEAQQLLQTDKAQIPTVKNLTNTEVHPEVQKLWDLDESGRKSIFLYSGYEDIIVDGGRIIQEAVLADSSEGMREKFVAICDEIHAKTVVGETGSKVYGHLDESLSVDDTARLTMAAVQQKIPADFMLATYRGINNGIINIKGVGGRLFSGDINEVQISVVIPTYGDTIVTVELTGAEVKALLQNGKTIIDANNEEFSAVFEYIAYGLDVTEKDGVISSVKLNGEELDDSKSYRVNFNIGDYSDDFAASHTIINSEVEIFDAIADYLTANSPITADKIK